MGMETMVMRINTALSGINPQARLPEGAVLPDFTTITQIDQQGIDEKIPERDPFNYFLHSALVCAGPDSQLCVVAPCDIPLEKCVGHFPKYPMVPLHVLGGAMALTSTVLVGHYMRESFPLSDDPFYPLAIERRQVSWTGGSRVLVPPITTVVTAEFLGYDSAKNKASTRAIVWSPDRAVALIDPLEFTVLPERFFAAMYKRSSRRVNQ